VSGCARKGEFDSVSMRERGRERMTKWIYMIAQLFASSVGAAAATGSSGVIMDSDCVTVSEVYWTRFLFVPREGVGVRDPD